MSVIAPDPALDFLALYADQTEDVILGRMMDWANEGLDPVADADAWVDTREGGHWRTCVTAGVREFARLYDLMGTEVPMSAFVLWAWGTYLDDLAAVFDVHRLTATFSTGAVVFSGANGTVINAGVVVSAVPISPDDPAPTYTVQAGGTIVGGSVSLAIQADEPGLAGDVAAGSITAQETPLPGITFTNPDPTRGGSDPETDDELRGRLLTALKGKGPGTVSDLVRWASAIPGVGRATAVPVWRGAGTSLVMVTDVNGQPLPSAIVTNVQDDLDPVAGKGSGTAPVGNAVTVETSTLLNITVAPTVIFESGYSADGFGGAVALRAQIEGAIAAYLLSVQPGDTVVYERIKGIIVTTPGVHDVTAMTVNGGTANIVVSLDPPDAPQLVTPIVFS